MYVIMVEDLNNLRDLQYLDFRSFNALPIFVALGLSKISQDHKFGSLWYYTAPPTSSPYY